MNLELDHVFILVKSEVQVTDTRLKRGVKEGAGHTHP